MMILVDFGVSNSAFLEQAWARLVGKSADFEADVRAKPFQNVSSFMKLLER